MKKKYTITAFSNNSPGVLYRIANLFLRRKINIESLAVSRTQIEGQSRFTIVVVEEPAIIEKVVKQLYRIIEVSKVYESLDDDLIYREVILIKVSTSNNEKRREILDIANVFEAKINLVRNDYIIIQKTGREDTIDSLVSLMEPFGIKEIVRSGRIALTK